MVKKAVSMFRGELNWAGKMGLKINFLSPKEIRVISWVSEIGLLKWKKKQFEDFIDRHGDHWSFRDVFFHDGWMCGTTKEMSVYCGFIAVSVAEARLSNGVSIYYIDDFAVLKYSGRTKKDVLIKIKKDIFRLQEKRSIYSLLRHEGLRREKEGI